MATYGPGIDQSQHAKSFSHIIKYNIILILYTSYAMSLVFSIYT